ncbi:MAG: ATP-binding cassette domain-containing protein [Lachnospiraceae bacterium]|nr:ATP-binding cassette domain-containing protein [Lachnospiraceae bacterium]
MIELKNISKCFGEKHIFEGFDIMIDDGDFIILCGESGAGKTTLLNIIAGLEKVDSGERNAPDDMRMSMVFQEDRLCAEFNAVNNVCLATEEISQDDAARELEKLLPKDRIGRKVKDLSGGEKRRVAVVRAMMHPADIYLLDEPFLGMDASLRGETLRYILEKKGESALVITAHEWNEDAGKRRYL